MMLFVSMLMAYLLGSIPTGFLITRLKTKADIRTVGSGNVGATNVLRAAGKIAALITLIIDIVKGYIAAAVLPGMLYTFRMDMPFHQYCVVLGFCAVIGHNWPVFLRFKGGKGVATSAGVLLGLDPILILIGLGAWLAVFIFTRIVSISSIVAAVAISVSAYIVESRYSVRILTIVLAVLMIARHHGNIKRLVKNTEKKISVRI